MLLADFAAAPSTKYYKETVFASVSDNHDSDFAQFSKYLFSLAKHLVTTESTTRTLSETRPCH